MLNNTLGQIQNNNLLLRLEIDRTPINEFQLMGYMARAFLALYPYGHEDL